MAIDNLLLSRFHCSRWCFQITLKTSLAQWIIEYPIITQCFKILQKSKKTIIRNIFYYIIIEYKPNKRESFTRQWSLWLKVMVLIYPDLSSQLVGKGKEMIDFTLCCQAVSVSLRLFASSLCTCSTWHFAFVALSMSLNLNT